MAREYNLPVLQMMPDATLMPSITLPAHRLPPGETMGMMRVFKDRLKPQPCICNLQKLGSSQVRLSVGGKVFQCTEGYSRENISHARPYSLTSSRPKGVNHGYSLSLFLSRIVLLGDAAASNLLGP